MAVLKHIIMIQRVNAQASAMIVQRLSSLREYILLPQILMRNQSMLKAQHCSMCNGVGADSPNHLSLDGRIQMECCGQIKVKS